MGIDIQRGILCIKGQRVNQIKLDAQEQQLIIHCSRDKRRKAIGPVTGQKGTSNRYVRRQAWDVPLFGYPCLIEIELAQVFIRKNERRMEHCEFVDKGWRFTDCWSMANCCLSAKCSRSNWRWDFNNERINEATRRRIDMPVIFHRRGKNCQ